LFFLGLLHFFSPVQSLFGLAKISFSTFLLCLLTAAVSVGWFEFYKAKLKLGSAEKPPDHKHAFS
ncbi:MAG TPA: hypothetical protein VFL47_15950, partial [Flavisolibacter sp.]|nr:hypothetical protein [Flavisolibacter sp.]